LCGFSQVTEGCLHLFVDPLYLGGELLLFCPVSQLVSGFGLKGCGVPAANGEILGVCGVYLVGFRFGACPPVVFVFRLVIIRAG
jgi:hypothetical protein